MVEIIGLSDFIRGLEDYQSTRDVEMAEGCREALDFVRSPLKEYPPERPGQTYVRTFDLQGGWEGASINYDGRQLEFSGTATNGVPHGPYVMGDPNQNPHQAWMHENHWNTTQDVVDDNEHELVTIFEAALERIAQRLGGP